MKHLTTVTLMQHARILMVLTHVNVNMVTLGMELLAVVSNFIFFSIFKIYCDQCVL